MQVVNRAKTECELTFVKRLGKWSEHELSRRDLLENYITATAFRSDWDGIDAARVRAYAAIQIHAISTD